MTDVPSSCVGGAPAIHHAAQTAILVGRFGRRAAGLGVNLQTVGFYLLAGVCAVCGRLES
jgi:hypothetical protein